MVSGRIGRKLDLILWKLLFRKWLQRKYRLRFAGVNGSVASRGLHLFFFVNFLSKE